MNLAEWGVGGRFFYRTQFVCFLMVGRDLSLIISFCVFFALGRNVYYILNEGIIA
jgi:hypothetical protein